MAVLLGCGSSTSIEPANPSLTDGGQAEVKRVPNLHVRARGEQLRKLDIVHCTIVFVRRRQTLEEAEGSLDSPTDDTTTLKSASTSDKSKIKAIIEALCSSTRDPSVADDPFTMADRVRSDYMTFRTPSNQEVHVGFFAETLERDHGPRLLEAVQQIVGPKKFEAVR